jgi:hypothetical protein
MRLCIVNKEEFALYLTTVPEYVNMSRVTSRIRMEAMFGINNVVRNVNILIFRIYYKFHASGSNDLSVAFKKLRV